MMIFNNQQCSFVAARLYRACAKKRDKVARLRKNIAGFDHLVCVDGHLTTYEAKVVFIWTAEPEPPPQ